ncbi:hypothetical protein HDC91_003212 [Mucilaginibacter sp. AK015]|nr:hypothetical protein [Mucilaginibacter sp. AK015]
MVAMLTSCTYKQKFERKGWNEGDGLTFPRRNLMVEDLLATHKLVGLKFNNIVGMLHYPDRFSRDSLSFHYEIIRKMSGIDTLYTKNLVFTMTKDSVITAVKVTERDYKEEKENKK